MTCSVSSTGCSKRVNVHLQTACLTQAFENHNQTCILNEGVMSSDILAEVFQVDIQ